MTNAQYLTQVETAISQLLAGTVKQYRIGDRMVTKLDLKELATLRNQLIANAQRDSTGAFSVANMRAW